MPHRLTLIDPRLPALLLALASAGVLAAALVFQYGFGYQPCILCIWQRWPYVAVLTFSIATLVFSQWRGVGDALLVASGFALLANAGIAFYHVGVEHHWWAGTAGCGVTGSAMTLEDLRAQVMRAPVVRCDEIQWELFGITMAGYNVMISLALAAFAFASARTAYVHAGRRGIPA
ncbi:MAG TPA: disulfide bond formation protein B [Azospirillum sp.]|nr:disulfide bond formation protein B [Azospirillum sp.]